jgi:S1-C subfamily serine protease
VRSHPPGPRNRALIPLLVVLVGVMLGAGGVLLLRPFGTPGTLRPSAPSRPAGAGQAIAGPLNDRAVYERLEPAVVDVTSTLRYDNETASGTGFIIDGRTALVLTNNHVIRDATSVTATLTSTGRTYPARIVGADVDADIAVLQLQGPAGLTAAPLGDSAAVTIGMPVLAIGNQAGRGGSPAIASGIVNGLNRTIQADDGNLGLTETLRGMLQTSTRIAPGDSGGPLADAAGEVIGVDTATGTGTSKAGYAIPINAAMAVERQIAAGHPAPGITIGVGGFLGVVVPSTASTSPRSQAKEGQRRTDGAASAGPHGCLTTEADAGMPAAIAPAPWGALVDGVLCGTGAAAAGIAAGDVIIAAAGRRVSSPAALTAIEGGCRPASVVPVTWVNTAGTTRTALVRVGVAPAV